jgi:hypothetical protein
MQRPFRRGFFALLGGALTVCAMLAAPAAAADVAATWTAGPGAVGDSSYSGFIDAPTPNATVPTGGFVVAGWFVDSAAEGWAGADDIQVFQGTMDGGGKMLARATFAQSRPDVAAALGNPFWAASGFAAFVPPGSLTPGSQVLSVYAHTPGKGWWYEQVPVNVASGAVAAAPTAAGAPVAVGQGAGLPIVAIEKPKDSEVVPTKNDYEIIGYALDPSAAPNQGVSGSGIDRVQVYIGNPRETGGIFLGEADLGFSDPTPIQQYGGQFISSGWRLTFKPTQFHANTFILYAYARSAISGKEDVAQRFFDIHE